jgi:hypothetical protein
MSASAPETKINARALREEIALQCRASKTRRHSWHRRSNRRLFYIDVSAIKHSQHTHTYIYIHTHIIIFTWITITFTKSTDFLIAADWRAMQMWVKILLRFDVTKAHGATILDLFTT